MFMLDEDIIKYKLRNNDWSTINSGGFVIKQL